MKWLCVLVVLCVVLGTGVCEELCSQAEPCRCKDGNFSVDFDEAVKDFP